jgi:hypothetical protein
MPDKEIAKKCSSCGALKPLSSYSPKSGKCKPCVSVRVKAWYDKVGRQRRREEYAKNPEPYRAKYHQNKEQHLNARLKREFGITLAQYEGMMIRQRGRCAICRTTRSQGVSEKLVVDHCHKTGHVRGLLCHHCNVAISMLGDCPHVMRIAASYVEKNKPITEAVSHSPASAIGQNAKQAGGSDMALRGESPSGIVKRLKMMLFGESGSGKSTCCCSFRNVYFIDTERGAENDTYVDLLRRSGGAYFFAADFDELLTEVTSLLSEDHQYYTLVIDPLTVIYNDLLDKSAKALATKDDPSGTSFGRHKAAADRKIKHLINLLLRLDMNVVVTSHAKTLWGDGMTKLGNTFDTFAKLDYICDLVIEVQKRGRDNRVGIVKKTRIKGFPEGESFPFSYDEIASRYGRDVLERKSVAVQLASDGEVAHLRSLVETLRLPADVTDKWLDKAKAESFHEMTSEQIRAAIQWCVSRVEKPQPETKSTPRKAVA